MQIFAKDFAKEWVEYLFNPIALASNATAKDSLFCNAIVNAQCERNLRAYSVDVKANASGNNLEIFFHNLH